MDNHNDEMNRRNDDGLFYSLDRNRKRKKKRQLCILTGFVLILILVGTVTVSSLKDRIWNQYGPGAGEVLRCQASIGTVRKIVSGSGILSDLDLETISVPEGVEVLDVFVKANAPVAAGQVLASVDVLSVRDAISDIEQQLTALDNKIRIAEDAETEQSVLSHVSGRVKVIYAQPGDDVEQTVFENGALAVLSLDGYMAVDISAGGLSCGDKVSIRWDGGSLPGTVDRTSGSVSTILFSDRGVEPEECVTVCDMQGEVLGIGSAYIHSPLRITGYVGVIEMVHVKKDDIVNAGTRLFTLTDTQCRVEYDSLLRQRSKLEAEFSELLKIQHYGAVVSPVSGRVYSTDDENSKEIAVISLEKEMTVTMDVDEADILALQVGQDVEVIVSSVGEAPFRGVLTKINKTINDGSYSAEVTLEKEAGMLSGMTADIKITVLCAENTVILPEKAINLTQSGAYVYTGYDPDSGKYENRVDVVLGVEGEGYVQIVEGLLAGDTVYYTNATTVKDLFDSMGGQDEDA